jgi:hypothetical protein
MVSGHTFELWLENLRVLGDGRANYAHSMQTFAIEVALVLLSCALVLVASHFLSRSRRAGIHADNLLPALDAVVRLGAARTVLILVSVQFAALVLVELLEQRGSGFNGGLSAIVGPGHATAIIVHAAVGLLFALALNRVARFVCAEARAIVAALSTFLRRATTHAAFTPATRTPLRLLASGRKPPLLALGLANRPPPSTSTIAA